MYANFKGIQCVEDAVLAAKAGVDGILISNHGGASGSNISLEPPLTVYPKVANWISMPS